LAPASCHDTLIVMKNRLFAGLMGLRAASGALLRFKIVPLAALAICAYGQRGFQPPTGPVPRMADG
jgi:hypothetical protein